MTRRGPVPKSLLLVLLLPVVVVVGFAMSWARNAIPSVRTQPAAIAYSHR